MCGIAGIISRDQLQINTPVLQRMAGSLAHRGPDGEACWINASGCAGFAHRRLSIIDISEAAAQPMHYLGRYTIVYNGEIYNYIELKETLLAKGYVFKTASDTEVILAAYDCYRSSCLQYFDGMFAFAIWDESEQLLFCARDRFGEKPFYYFHDQVKSGFYFGSEMKALAAAGLEKTINQYMVLQYLAYGYTSDLSDPSRTFDNRFLKLPPAHHLSYSPAKNSVTIQRYWQLDKDYMKRIPVAEASEYFLHLLSSSVKRRLRSDVPLGASLSGGLDSSAIVALMSKLAPDAGFKTFTAAFPGYEKDESEQARAIASRFGLGQFSVIPTAEGLLNAFEKLMVHQEEPVTSASVYAQFRVFELAKEHSVKVLLDGQGADETLAGYDKYKTWGWRALFPELTARVLKSGEQRRLTVNKDLDRNFLLQFKGETRVFKPVVRRLNDLLYFNTIQSGLEELLRYADRNAMAHGREVRLPFLNADLVSFVFSLPSSYKIHGPWTKWILRLAIADSLPSEVAWNRKKIGFEPPQRLWMNTKGVKEYIQEAKKTLISKQILDKSVAGSAPSAHAAYIKNGFDWRYMSLALVLP